ncbi:MULTISPECIES: SusC/RagA family TonB-linked outer membrane protein [Butyricimonas]|uniref:SusC/RagA family TonB-linked outer membrane protein n=1 Tax=Butyricimonas TaxID=574697 RepID=UPI001D0638C0|nr:MULTISPECIES: SusC/RagA family TonB-linked outer membrane protein [Butyricimonas]MCB6971020.1 SusC/RagA family TonB-linked outer membrane protein [Butyricimonas synergistica]MCG4517734.1 SusC/RagA family TonB-linked outer membrane protein [Butyricimonas sp. DFI.6.44]
MKKKQHFLSLSVLFLKRVVLLTLIWGGICCSPVRAADAGQPRKVTLNLKGVSLSVLFNEIKKQTSYKFFYNDTQEKNIGKVTVSVTDETVENVLKRVFENSAYTFQVVGEQIVITDKKMEDTRQKNVRITGLVTDQHKIPLSGVTVVVKGVPIGTATDVDGRYALTLPVMENMALIFSFIGMETQEVKYTGLDTINVILQEQAETLQDVVVTGIFKKNRESYTGAVRVVTAQELKNFKGRNLIASLANIDPAFNLIANNDLGSNPNRLPEVQIRGAASLPNVGELQDNTSADLNTPLIILDGFETTLQRMMDLDDNEVASITILKDGSATALYGSRGANGVIVITTREPEPGKLRFYYKGEMNIETPDLSDYHVLNSRDKLRLEEMSGYYHTTTLGPDWEIRFQEYHNAVLAQVEKGVDTDWLSIPLRTGVGHRHNLRVEGGDASFRYSLSLQYNLTEGVMKDSKRENFNGEINLSYKHQHLIFSNRLSIGLNKASESPYGAFSDYVKLNPYWEPYDQEGNVRRYFAPYNWGYWANSSGVDSEKGVPNPLYDATLKTYDKSNYTNITNNFSIEWTPIPELTFRGRVGISGQMNESDVFRPSTHSSFVSYTGEDVARKGSYQYGTGKDYRYEASFTANYRKLFGGKHLVYAGVNAEMSESTGRSYTFKVEGFADESIDFLSMGLQYEKEAKPSGSESKSRRVGLVGNVNYSYDNRYFMDFNIRTDGSSQFGSSKRFAPFYSVGLGWNVHNEEFFRNNIYINRLKLRASYGVSGSQQFSSYQAMETYSYYVGDRYNIWMGAYQMALGNKNLEWQTVDKYNVGFEGEFLNSRVSLDLDVYLEKTSSLLSSLELPYSNGFDSYTENIGSVENSGFELKASVWLLRDTEKRLMWSVTGNIAHNKDKITKLSEAMKAANEKLARTSGSNPNRILREGDSQNAIYAVPSLGIDPSSGEEIYLKKNGEVTKLWSADDRVKCGVAQPKYRGNLSTMVRYKDLSLNMSFGFRWGGQQYNQTLIDRVENADKRYNVDDRVFKDRWQNPGDKTFFKGVNVTRPSYYSSRFVQDETSFWCQNMNLTYELRDWAWMRHLGVSVINATVGTGELFYLSTIKQERGLSYPFSRQYIMSLSVMF